MTKSNQTEIIAILWLIAGLLTPIWLHWVWYGLAVENILESVGWAIHERKPKPKATV
jgi:hypothetical protein